MQPQTDLHIGEPLASRVQALASLLGLAPEHLIRMSLYALAQLADIPGAQLLVTAPRHDNGPVRAGHLIRHILDTPRQRKTHRQGPKPK